MIGERDLIDELSRIFGLPPPQVVCGIGDDAAVIAKQGGEYLLWTVDALIEKVHFDLAYMPLRQLGRKALAVNLSDIAAMGGKPRYALLALGWPPERDLSGALELARGMQEVAQETGVTVIGGDTVSSPGSLSMSLTVLGQVKKEELLRRDGAQIGELIYLTGPVGLAAAGLETLRRGLTLTETERTLLLQAFFDPQPQILAARVLARNHLATALIDLSDGVASDLFQICRRSNVGAVVESTLIPVPAPVAEVAAQIGKDPLELALKGGEDYLLLFTSPPDREKALYLHFSEAGLGTPICIGKIVRGNRVWLRRPEATQDISGMGFDHFRLKEL